MRLRLLLLILLLGLLASISVNVYLFDRADGYYRELNVVRLDPLGLEAYPVPANRPDGQVVVLFGDSRVAQWPQPDLAGLTVVNRGIGAQTTAQALGRFAAHVTPLQPDIVLIQVGVNDLKTLPLFPGQSNDIIHRAQANITALVEQARATGATVILSTIFPVGEVPLLRRPYWSPAVAVAVRDVNAHLHTLAADGVIVFDAYALLAAESGLIDPVYAVDELHLSAAGYALLNAELSGLLAGLR